MSKQKDREYRNKMNRQDHGVASGGRMRESFPREFRFRLGGGSFVSFAWMGGREPVEEYTLRTNEE